MNYKQLAILAITGIIPYVVYYIIYESFQRGGAITFTYMSSLIAIVIVANFLDTDKEKSKQRFIQEQKNVHK